MHMKTSVLIIAHNEEQHIEQCITSVLNQTQKPDEIVLIAHNCSDQTVLIAQKYPVEVVEYYGPEGVPYARIKGFEKVQGDIVACIDGDSVADRKWLSQLIKPLVRNPAVTIVAGYVVITNSVFSRLTSLWQFMANRKLFRTTTHLFAWGSNFACRKVDYERVGGIAPVIKLRQTLPLHFWAEDLYISLALMQVGQIYIALRAKTYTQLPRWKLQLSTAPIRKWRQDNRTLLKYFKKLPFTSKVLE